VKLSDVWTTKMKHKKVAIIIVAQVLIASASLLAMRVYSTLHFARPSERLRTQKCGRSIACLTGLGVCYRSAAQEVKMEIPVDNSMLDLKSWRSCELPLN
jgi:hypothetical protein